MKVTLNTTDNNNTTFGWRYTTHKELTALAVNDIPKLRKYKDILVKFSQKPDFDERGFEGNNHFYYPPKLLRPRESFLDVVGRNNAGAKFNEHIFYFKEFLYTNKEKALEHAGRALHFLQDVTQPQHTERGTIYKKWKDLKIHKEFEEFALQNQDSFTYNTKPSELSLRTGGVDELFEDAVDLSQKGKQVTKDNRNEWREIAHTGISNAVQATKLFCEYIASFM